MAQVFGNEIFKEPSVATRIITDIAPTPNLLSSGVVALIGESDAGLTYEDGKIHVYDNPNDLKKILRGGTSYRMLDFIFNPSPDSPGAQKVVFIRAQTATKATATFTDGSNYNVKLDTVDKGGYLSDPVNGFAYRIISGILDANAHILLLQFNGLQIWSSKEFNTPDEMKAVIEADSYASTVLTVTINSGGTYTLLAGDNMAAYTFFAGGTSPAMTGADIDSSLELLKGTRHNILVIGSEDSSNYLKGLSFINNTIEFKSMLFAGGALGENKTQVIARANALNHENALLAYPGFIVQSIDGTTTETLSPMYSAAILSGLAAGLPPEVPLTYKRLNVLGFEISDLSKTIREEFVDEGVTYLRNIPGKGFGVNKGITTLKANGSLFYKKQDGTVATNEVSINRIIHQIINELEVNSAPLFVGGTEALVTKADVVGFTEGYLDSRVSTPTQSNLLKTFRSVDARFVDSAWYVNFGLVFNGPINFVFFTGVALGK